MYQRLCTCLAHGYSFSSEMLRSLRLCPLPDWCERGWQSQTVISGAAWWSHNPALEYRHSTYLFLVQTQLRYIYLLLSHHHSPTSSDLAIMITPFSAHTLEQMHLGTRLHSSHPPAAFVLSDCWISMNNYLWQTPTDVVSRVPGTIGTCPCSCFKTKIWPHLKSKSCLYLS